MRFGRYDQKIQFVSYGSVSDEAGGTIPSELVLLTTFARIEQLTIRADIEQSQMELPETYRVWIMVRSGFTPTVGMSLKWRGRVFKIQTTPQVKSVRIQHEWFFDIVS